MSVPVSVLVLLVGLLSTPHLCVAEEPDPRPAVLVIGDHLSLPHRGSPSWADNMADRHPEWRVAVAADFSRLIGKSVIVPEMKKGVQIGERTVSGALSDCAAILTASGQVTLVVVFLGMNNARQPFNEQYPPETCGRDMAALLARLRAAPQTRDARLVVVTPLPVVEARLDQWSRDAFAGGEEHCRATAQAIAAAVDADAVCIDAWSWGWERTDAQGLRGEPLGSVGWLMPGWAQVQFADWLIPQIEALEPAPLDAAGYAAWQEVRAGMAGLADILAATAEGIVRHGAALSVGEIDKEAKGHPPVTVQIPPTLLTAKHLDLLVMPATTPHAVVSVPRTPFGGHPMLHVTTTDGSLAIEPEGSDYRLLDEAEPETLVPGDRYGFNSGKWQPFAMLCSTPGQRRWLLLRFDLSELAGKTVQAAEVVLRHLDNPGAIQRLIDGKPQQFDAEGAFGAVAVHPVLDPDRAWLPSAATWSSPDGRRAWTGGAVDQADRRERIGEFLRRELPAEVAEAARACLE